MLKILFYALCITGFYLLVEKLFVSFKLNNSSLQKRGVKLFEQLLEGELSSVNLTKYKFYTCTVETLVKSSKTYGIGIHEQLVSLKHALMKDINFEKKVRSCSQGALLQMLLISIVRVIFALLCTSQLEIQLPIAKLVGIFAFEGIGIAIFFASFHLYKKSLFSPLEQLVEKSYMLKTFMDCQLSISESLKLINITELEGDKSVMVLKGRLEEIIKKIRLQGSFQRELFDILVQEIWFIFELRYQKFEKYLLAAKLAIMTLFFLPAYLYTIYGFLEMTSL